ncbi:MAG: tetratricopeptide repeat protein [Nitrosomonas sp.]|nr:tetratricopeptide repeat protein [Nitrosomonas sp.]
MKLLIAVLIFSGLLFAATTINAQHTKLDALNIKVVSLYQQGKYVEAIAIAKQALDIAEKDLGQEHSDVATSLNNLAELYRTQGQYEKAEPLYQRALTIRVKALGSDHSDVATSLNNLAVLYFSLGQYDKAEPLYQRSLVIKEKALGPDHPDVALGLSNLAVLYNSLGQYDKTELLHQRSLVIREKALGSDHPDVAESLNNLAVLYQEQGQPAKAEPLLQHSLNILEKALGPEHPNVAQSLNNLAMLYRDQGQPAKAEPLFQRSLAIREKALGSEHPDVAQSLHDLAMLYRDQGQPVKAEPPFQRSLAIREKALGSEHPDVAQSLHDLARLYQDQGQIAKAEPLFQRSLVLREKVLGPEHPGVAESLNSLASLYQAQGQIVKAELLHQRALTILEKALGATHPNVASSLHYLASLYQDQGQFAKAESLFLRSLAIQEKSLGSEHSYVALSLNNLATIYQAQGKHAKAELFYQRSLVIQEKALGPEHPHLAASLKNLSINRWAQGGSNNIDHVVELYQRALNIREHHLRLFMTKGSEDDKRDYIATIAGDPDVMTTLHLAAGSTNVPAARLALATVLQRKGRLLDAVSESTITLRRRMRSGDNVLFDQLADVNSQRANLFNRALQSQGNYEDYSAQKIVLEAKAQDLEVKINAISAEFQTTNQSVTLEHIQKAIPKGSVLVEYLRYSPFSPKTVNSGAEWAPERYIAYMLLPQGDPISVELGDAAAIDQMVRNLRLALADDNRDSSVKEAARKLDIAIMQPVRNLLGTIQTILLSPDGTLNLVPFAALQDENNRYLIERYAFTYLSSGRDLLRLNTHIASQQPATIFADIDYGKSDKPGFRYLEGTKDEAIEIGKMLPSARILTGLQATESVLKQLNRPEILHVATHGFFRADQHEPYLNPIGNRSRADWEEGIAQPKAPGPSDRLLSENPLLRSGLVLANANLLKSGEEDGLLTALEVTGLDLWGTKLVVLSACETGVGEVQNGQGVYGLRRALVIAGSESQVMSLWKVADNATKDLMVDYYQRLLASEGRSEAMRQAQLTMLASENRNHPYYWASFIVSGDWAPMDRKELLAK